MKQKNKKQARHTLKRIGNAFLACMLLATMMSLQTAFAQEEKDTTVLSKTEDSHASSEPQQSVTEDEVVSQDQQSSDTTQVLTETPSLEPGDQAGVVSAGLRTAPLATPKAAGGTLVVDTDTYTLGPDMTIMDALQSIGYSEADIAAATILKFTGSQENLYLTDGTTYLNSLAITALDFSEFRGTFESYTFGSLSKITTIVLGEDITALPRDTFVRCTSLTTVSNTLENAANNPGVIDLSRTGVTSLANGHQFEGCSSLTKVALGDAIELLPLSIFWRCSSLTTVGKTPDTLNEGIIDLANTGLRYVESYGYQFRGCSALTTVTLGNIVSLHEKEDGTLEEVNELPMGCFDSCTNLVTVSDTRAHAQQKPGIIDLEKTKMSSFNLEGGQFAACSSLTTVTLGTSIGVLPIGVFVACSNLATVAASVAELEADPENYGIVDLERTGVTTFKAGTEMSAAQFADCAKITTVILGGTLASSAVLPQEIFRGCSALATVTDTRENAKGKSAGLVDVETLPQVFEMGSQFAYTRSLIYMGNSTRVLPWSAFFGATCFLPRTNTTVTIEGDQSFSTLLVRGLPGGAVPDVITFSPSDATYEIGDIFPYYEVGGTTDGHGSIAKKSGGFLADPFERREILEGTLASGKNYVQGSVPFTYTITPDVGYRVKSITANGAAITPTAIDGNDYTFEGVSDDTTFQVTFSLVHTVTEHYVDRSGSPIGLSDTATANIDHETAYTGKEAPAVLGYLYAGAAYEAPTVDVPSFVTNKDKPALSNVTEDASVWYVYGTDRATGSGGGETINPNNKEDLEVACSWIDEQGSALSSDLSLKPFYFDIGSLFTLSYNAGVSIPSGWEYVGCKVNGNLSSDPSFEIDLSVPLVKTVEYVFARQLNEVVITHVDEKGNPLGSLDTTKQVAYGDDLTYSVPSFTGYTYSHWMLDGVSQGSGTPSLTQVTAPHAIQLVYCLDSTPEANNTQVNAVNPGLSQTEDSNALFLAVCLVMLSGLLLSAASFARRRVRASQKRLL